MLNNDITFCSNHRCKIKDICKRASPSWPKKLQHISMACFGPVNGDTVTKPSDCDCFIKKETP